MIRPMLVPLVLSPFGYLDDSSGDSDPFNLRCWKVCEDFSWFDVMIVIRVCEECVRMCKDQAIGVVDLPATPSYLIGLSVHIFAGFTGHILQSLLMLADGYDYTYTDT